LQHPLPAGKRVGSLSPPPSIWLIASLVSGPE
jgi:hypothetical protein